MKANRLTYHERYDDDSGVEFGVTYKDDPYIHDTDIRGVIILEHVDTVAFPITQLDWLIECLERVRSNVENEQ